MQHMQHEEVHHEQMIDLIDPQPIQDAPHHADEIMIQQSEQVQPEIVQPVH